MKLQLRPLMITVLKMTLNEDDVNVSTACVTQFISDKSWYQSKFTEIKGNQYTVQFVDYGYKHKDVKLMTRFRFSSHIGDSLQIRHCFRTSH